jgi:16S rRNA (guanine(527)-N(7))-methyltransferase RsmG
MRLSGLGSPPEELSRGVAAYLRELDRWRPRVNLMGNCTSEEIIRFHFCEAFWAADRFLGGGESIADIGSGGGFPGLAMKLFRPSLRVTLLERTHKKCVFLESTARRLELGVSVQHVSAEDWGGWETVDCASVRAVRLGRGLLERLENASVALLHFRGADADPGLSSWHPIREEAYPPGNNRWVGLYRPAGGID